MLKSSEKNFNKQPLKLQRKKLSLPQMENKILIEKKISEIAQQNQTRIDTGEAGGENWPLRKLYTTEVELT